MIIAVAGNVGSGKSTLAKHIASNYGFHYVPSRRLEFDFIDAFFNNIEGLFFPAQVSFLISKAIEIQEHISNGRDIVVDRSLLEDINVFARLWIENRPIDDSIVKLYKHTANFIINAIPSPDLYIVCNCSAIHSAERIAKRPQRSFEKAYPPNHVEMLAQYYSELAYESTVPRLEIDTTIYDLRNKTDVEFIIKQLTTRYENQPHCQQLSFFEEAVNPPQGIAGLSFYNFEISNRRSLLHLYQHEKKKKYIYLAAPFTQFAPHKKDNPSLTKTLGPLLESLNLEHSYGELNKPYQLTLRKIEKTLEEITALPVHLPHRDINNWGKTMFPSEHITPQIVDAVQNATALCAIPGSSIGVHFEIGLAIAQGIPIVLIETDDLQSSFFIRGFESLPNVLVRKAKKLSKVSDVLQQIDVQEFLRNSIGG